MGSSLGGEPKLKPLIRRPDRVTAKVLGLMRQDQFQVAYITNDMGRACEMFLNRYGIEKWCFLNGAGGSGGVIEGALGWVGAILYEIIDAKGGEWAFYNRLPPEDEFAICLHHAGYLIHYRSAWLSLEEEFAGSSFLTAFAGLDGTFLDAYYIKASELGRYLKYIYE